MTPHPLSLRPGLLRHTLDDQLLVYDPPAQQVHLLDGTTAAVVEMIDQGVSPDSIAVRLGEKEGTERGAELLELALDQLAQARLVESPENGLGPQIMDTTRRQMIQRLVGLGAAFVVPAIVTLTPSRAYAATGLANGQACGASSQCASGCCKNNSAGTGAKDTCVTQDGLDTCKVP